MKTTFNIYDRVILTSDKYSGCKHGDIGRVMDHNRYNDDFLYIVFDDTNTWISPKDLKKE